MKTRSYAISVAVVVAAILGGFSLVHRKHSESPSRTIAEKNASSALVSADSKHPAQPSAIGAPNEVGVAAEVPEPQVVRLLNTDSILKEGLGLSEAELVRVKSALKPQRTRVYQAIAETVSILEAKPGSVMLRTSELPPHIVDGFRTAAEEEIVSIIGPARWAARGQMIQGYLANYLVNFGAKPRVYVFEGDQPTLGASWKIDFEMQDYAAKPPGDSSGFWSGGTYLSVERFRTEMGALAEAAIVASK